MSESGSTVRVAAERVETTIALALEALSVSPEAAAATATVLVEADLAGVDSHGIHLLPMYVRRIGDGSIDPQAPVTITRDDGSTLWLDAHLGLGQSAGLRAVDEAIARAPSHGVVTVSVREATHLGALGAYTRRIAAAGYVGLCVQNGPTIVPPYGGVTPLFSTNPLSYAIPTVDEPTIVFDIATTAVAGNKLLLAKKRGDPTIPEGWANDEHGRPTTDTDAASVWSLQWFGGHKGYGLGLLVEILAGVLAGSSYGRTEETESPVSGRGRVAKGATFIALDPDRFIGRDAFARRTDALIRDIRTSDPAEAVDEILVPGLLEHRRAEARRRDGIPLPTAIVTEIDEIARELGAPTLT